MILGIDASNIRAGGGVTHLVELLRAARPETAGFTRVVLWGGRQTLARVDDRPWLVKSHQPLLDRSLPLRTFWQGARLSRLAHGARCDVLFVPGGSYLGTFRPMVTFNQNLLPFDIRELRRFGFSWTLLRGLLLRTTQGRTFRHADGVIFLTRHAADTVRDVIGRSGGASAIIPHGVDPRFDAPPRVQLPLDRYSPERPFKLLYVSVVNAYKHQWHVVDAVARLRAEGLPVTLELVGPGYGQATARLQEAMRRHDPEGAFVRYAGAIDYNELHARYHEADLFVFASSCETFGQIVTEAMASGLPVACSNRAAMPELLGDAGVYFDPENPHDIACALLELINSPRKREQAARDAFLQARQYSWGKCADQTFAFLAAAARREPIGAS